MRRSTEAMRPLLRSPPFPYVPGAIAAVSAAEEHSGIDQIDEEEIDRLFAAIGVARVGGTFWGSPPPGSITAVLAPRNIAEFPTLLASLDIEERRRPLLLASPSRSIPTDVVTSEGAIDPWILLDLGVPIIAHGDHDLAALARIVGAPLRLIDAGRYGRPSVPEAANRRTIAETLLRETRYRDPFTDKPTDAERTIALLSLWRATVEANRDITVACGMAWWKRTEIGRLLWAPRARPLRFVRSPERAVHWAAKAGGGIAVWPSRVSARLVDAARSRDVSLIRIEDGFVRSVGLGSNLFPPYSITVDRQGIHYDPSRPSDLEDLLGTADFAPALLDRAERLRRFVVAKGIGKYGAGEQPTPLPRNAARRLVLVPGQVEDDLSVLSGGGEVAGNEDLLRRVRAIEPDAEIWFRPHPDVDAGHRRGAVRDDAALRHADRVVRGGGMARLLDTVDAVHVLTSLTGFEALLRRREVTTHGMPFYAGWGLTRDLAPVPDRRRRRLGLLELVAGVMILYPRYLDPVTGLPCPAETLIARMAAQSRPRGGWLTGLRALQGIAMRPLR